MCVCSLVSIYRALKEADVIVLLGARLNWILHFGLSPRFKKDVKFIQVQTAIHVDRGVIGINFSLLNAHPLVCCRLTYLPRKWVTMFLPK